MKIHEFLNQKNSGRKIKMFVAQEYLDGRRAQERNGGKSHIWRAFFSKRGFSYMVRDENIREDYVEILSVNEYQYDRRNLSLTLRYKDETFEHYEPMYFLNPYRLELDKNGKIMASYFTTFNYVNEDKYSNRVEWKDQQ